MIVIAIIGILAAIAIPQFAAYRTRSFNSLAVANLRDAATAQEAYFVDNLRYTNSVNSMIGFYQSDGVNLQINSASNTSYDMISSHNKGDKTYTMIGPGGSITGN